MSVLYIFIYIEAKPDYGIIFLIFHISGKTLTELFIFISQRWGEISFHWRDRWVSSKIPVEEHLIK